MEQVLRDSSVGIRVPATANLMIDSQDRRNPALPPWDFTINKSQNVLNGFFNRIGATEVVFEWGENNVTAALGNTAFTVNVTGAPANPYTINLPEGLYTVASALEELVVLLNSGSVGGVTTWAVAASVNGAYITSGGPTWSEDPTSLSTQLGFSGAPAAVEQFAIISKANLSPFRYIDILSNSLTYNQELKDASTTQSQTQDVLVRWYFCFDNPVQADQFGFPIFMGMEPFELRRIYSPPKQIKWDKIQPIGQLNFELYVRLNTNLQINGQDYLPLKQVIPISEPYTNWLMTLQVSEN